MQQEQLALFGDSDVTGSGKPYPWPVAAPELEADTEAPVDPDQLTFDETDTEAAA